VVSNLKHVLSVYRISSGILINCNYMETSITAALQLIVPSCEVEIHLVCIDMLQHIVWNLLFLSARLHNVTSQKSVFIIIQLQGYCLCEFTINKSLWFMIQNLSSFISQWTNKEKIIIPCNMYKYQAQIIYTPDLISLSWMLSVVPLHTEHF